jgi:hypothetical protein
MLLVQMDELKSSTTAVALLFRQVVVLIPVPPFCVGRHGCNLGSLQNLKSFVVVNAWAYLRRIKPENTSGRKITMMEDSNISFSIHQLYSF